MASRYCGIDFGTSNSCAALADGDQVRVLELDPSNDTPTCLPSLLYVSNEAEKLVGRTAATAFIERNVDREVVLKQVDLGISIEGYVGSEPDKSESYRPREDITPIPEAVRAKALVEVNSPGRLFQSLKSYLRYPDFKGTEVFGEIYQIEELIAVILRRLKDIIDREAGEPIERAVFGRPVHFSLRDGEDDLAENRLRTAAGLAGFKEVTFFYEPVAACVEYAIRTDRQQRLMVVDIGGGTCDVCIMEFGGSHRAAERLSESRILGVAGVPIAGDAIDKEVIRQKLFPCFGSRSRFGPSNLPMPQYVYNAILDWQNLYKLNTEETINWLLATEACSNQPEAIRALRCLIQRNYGYPVVRKVEQAKKLLSDAQEATVEIRHDDIRILERLQRSEFTHIIEPVLDDMYASIDEAERVAGVTSASIDFVLTTGGTSLIPAIRNHLIERYGEDRMQHRDTFTSVASGLAVVAQYA